MHLAQLLIVKGDQFQLASNFLALLNATLPQLQQKGQRETAANHSYRQSTTPPKLLTDMPESTCTHENVCVNQNQMILLLCIRYLEVEQQGIETSQYM